MLKKPITFGLKTDKKSPFSISEETISIESSDDPEIGDNQITNKDDYLSKFR